VFLVPCFSPCGSAKLALDSDQVDVLKGRDFSRADKVCNINGALAHEETSAFAAPLLPPALFSLESLGYRSKLVECLSRNGLDGNSGCPHQGTLKVL
jgi:hypothetical protein